LAASTFQRPYQETLQPSNNPVGPDAAPRGHVPGEAGLVPNMLVHDIDRCRRQRSPARCRDHAPNWYPEVCKLSVDVTSDQKGQRFIDKRDVAKAMWAVIMDVLREIGALPKTGGVL
jgi:hypothetical protein